MTETPAASPAAWGGVPPSLCAYRGMNIGVQPVFAHTSSTVHSHNLQPPVLHPDSSTAGRFIRCIDMHRQVPATSSVSVLVYLDDVP